MTQNVLSPIVLRLRDAYKTVQLPTGEDLPLLRGMNLEVAAGTMTAIMGPSGSGKTTLLRVLGLFIGLDDGEYELVGQDMRAASDKDCSVMRSDHIGFVFQQFQLMPALNAYDNVMYACYLTGMGRRERRKAVNQALEWVGLSERKKSRVHQLSGGEQQRVSIARALVKQPKLILADEPTGALDRSTAISVMELMRHTVVSTGAAMIVVTHDEAVAAGCDAVYDLRDGQLWARQQRVAS